MMHEWEKKITGMMGWDDGKDKGTPSSSLHNVRPNHVDLSLNFNNAPCKYDMAIIVTSWWGQLLWLKSSLTRYRLSGKFVICAYDNPFVSWGMDNLLQVIPSKKIWLLPHAWVFKHSTFDAVKREGWFWDVFYARGIINQFKNFKYVLHTNGDCIWEKPENVSKLIDLLGDGDVTGATGDRNTIHTVAVLYKIDSFNAIWDYMFERYKTAIFGSWSPEGMLIEAINTLGMKEVKAPKQPLEPDGSGAVDHYCRYNQDSTWKELVGFRNLGAEYTTCSVERKEPIDVEYVDMDYINLFLSSGGYPLLDYYRTGDRKYLYMLYDRNEDSWYDRLCYPIEHYEKNIEYYRAIHNEK